MLAHEVAMNCMELKICVRSMCERILYPPGQNKWPYSWATRSRVRSFIFQFPDYTVFNLCECWETSSASVCSMQASCSDRRMGTGAGYKLDIAQLTALWNVPWCDNFHGIRRHIWIYNHNPSALGVIVYYMDIQLPLNASSVVNVTTECWSCNCG